MTLRACWKEKTVTFSTAPGGKREEDSFNISIEDSTPGARAQATVTISIGCRRRCRPSAAGVACAIRRANKACAMRNARASFEYTNSSPCALGTRIYLHNCRLSDAVQSADRVVERSAVVRPACCAHATRRLQRTLSRPFSASFRLKH